MRILVTGGAGYIGSHTVRRLLAGGHDVWIYDNLSTGHRAAVPADRLIVADLAEADRLDHALMAHRIEAVVHFAASALVGESVREPARYYKNNVCNSVVLMDLMRRHGVKRFVFSSTCATYGIPEAVPITENEPQRPISPYGNTKLAVERAFLDHAGAYGWGGVILRYFNAAGAAGDGSLGEDHDPETHLIPLVIQSVLGLRPAIDILGTDYPTADGTCIRDYIHVEDIADAHAKALEGVSRGEVLCCNLGTGRGHSVREVIASVEKVSGRKVAVKESPRRPGDPPVMVADGSLAGRALGWRPNYPDLKSIIETAWRWHRSHPRGYDD